MIYLMWAWVLTCGIIIGLALGKIVADRARGKMDFDLVDNDHLTIVVARRDINGEVTISGNILKEWSVPIFRTLKKRSTTTLRE